MATSKSFDVRPLVSRIADVLREQIISGELSPGRRIAQEEVASSLGVSRTPIREAFQLLAAEGWVRTKPRTGVEVTSLSSDEVQDIAVMRLLAEPYAAGLNAQVHDEGCEEDAQSLAGQQIPSHDEHSWFDRVESVNRQFHFLIYGMLDGQLPGLLESSIRLHWDRFARYRRLRWAEESLIRRSHEQHQAILEAWMKRDAVATQHAVAAHIVPVAVDLVHRIDPDASLKASFVRLSAMADVDL